MPATADSEYLLRRLRTVEQRVRAAVSQRRDHDSDPDDQFRGLYITDEQAQNLFDRHPTYRPGVDAAPDAGDDPGCRLAALRRNFGLSPLDVEILLVALAPDLDPRFEKAYGYLHDDVSRRRPSIGLAIELAGGSMVDPEARGRLLATGPLVRGGLVVVEEAERPFLTRSLRVPDSVTAYLLGTDHLDLVTEQLTVESVASVHPGFERVRRGLDAGASLFYVRDRVGAAALSYATGALDACGLGAIVVDASRFTSDDVATAQAVVRDARLRGNAVVVGPIEAILERSTQMLRVFTEPECVAVLIGSRSWDPAWSRTVPVLLDAPGIRGYDSSSFRLTPEQHARAERFAELQAKLDDDGVSESHFALGVRSQNASGLERLALRVSPQVSWDDLVVPDYVRVQLHELVDRVRFRTRVLDDWAVRRGATKGRGVTALFSGDSGTGKTLSAEVIASALGLDLYVVDLATVVDKYIGETEKNLDRIFNEADRVNGVLLFDEADAIFGKRSEVQDARDRYANVEVAYLLQRMERFDGIAILTTNLRANVDQAFLRRLDALIDFPNPDRDMRCLLWERHLPPGLPRGDDVDLAFLAQAFDLSGGNIRNVAMAAAFYSAAADEPLTMASLIKGTAREYRKLGRLCVEVEFGPYFALTQSVR